MDHYFLEYHLSFPERKNHYLQLELRRNHLLEEGKEFIDFKLPVWTPGSYLVREYARFVERVEAENERGEPLGIEKRNKNTWRVHIQNAQTLVLKYRVYGRELSVRNNFVDESHAFVIGAASFMYEAGEEERAALLKITLPEDWKHIYTALPSRGEGEYEVADLDTLVDSPLEIGNAYAIPFSAENLDHRYVFYGLEESLFNRDELIRDSQAIIAAARSIWPEHPVEREYLIIVHFLDSVRGGLEHKDSTVLQFPRLEFQTETGYIDFLSLMAHEYFHLWNVKRLRPEPLGPFDYDAENYCSLLWQVEGFTSYYEKLILFQAGIIDQEAYLQSLADKINRIENQPGLHIQSLSESSWDAWIKAYRPHENSVNSGISYYTKGAIIALLLDILLISGSEGEHCLDELLANLYTQTYQASGRAYKAEELKAELERLSGISLDSFYSDYIDGLTPIPYASFFNKIGLELQEKENPPLEWGIIWSEGNRVQQVLSDSVAAEAGLSPGDEILSIEGEVFSNGASFMEKLGILKNKPEILSLKLKRAGQWMELKMSWPVKHKVQYSLGVKEAVSEGAKKQFRRWLRLD